MFPYNGSCFWRSMLVIFATAFLVCPQPGKLAAAAEAAKLPGSLQLVPHDAAFYGGFYRGKQLLQAVLNSGAFEKAKELGFVQEAVDAFKQASADADSPLGKLNAMLAGEDGRKLLDLLGDMLSQEVFILGDQSVTDVFRLIDQLNWASQTGTFKSLVSGRAGPEANLAATQEMLSLAAANAHRLKVPNLIIGFKLRDPAAAKEQLATLEKLVQQFIEQEPKLQNRLKRMKVAGHEYLVLSLDGELIAWEELPIEQFRLLEARDGDVDKLVVALKKVKAVIAMGLRDEYLLVSVGSSLDLLKQLGQGKTLADRPELKPLAKHADKQLVMVNYATQELMAATEDTRAGLDELAKMIKDVLAEAELEPKLKDRLSADVGALIDDLKTLFPAVGATLQFAFLSDEGIENYTYNWGDYPRIDGSKPLGLLQHLGGSPLVALVGRERNDVRDYDALVKWLKTAYGYFEEFALPAMEPPDRKQAELVIAGLKPLAARADKATRELLYPALAEGQTALVLDAKQTSKQLHTAMPEATKPLPVFEPAVVVAVSDANKLQHALREYRAVLNDGFEVLRKIEDAQVPDWLKIPAPEVVPSSAGKIFAYRLPKDWGVDEKIAPSFGLTEKVGVFATSVQHTERLLRPTPPKHGRLLEATKRPAAAALLVDVAGLVDAVSPWLDYLVEQSAPQEADRLKLLFITSQMHTILELLKTVRTITNVSYFQDGALVSHTVIEIKDIGR